LEDIILQAFGEKAAAQLVIGGAVHLASIAANPLIMLP